MCIYRDFSIFLLFSFFCSYWFWLCLCRICRSLGLNMPLRRYKRQRPVRQRARSPLLLLLMPKSTGKLPSHLQHRRCNFYVFRYHFRLSGWRSSHAALQTCNLNVNLICAGYPLGAYARRCSFNYDARWYLCQQRVVGVLAWHFPPPFGSWYVWFRGAWYRWWSCRIYSVISLARALDTGLALNLHQIVWLAFAAL